MRSLDDIVGYVKWEDACDIIVDEINRLRPYLPSEERIIKLLYGVLQKFIDMPSADVRENKAQRVNWSGWKGIRDTRYSCPSCKKPVRNDDKYCHRCGQKLMFPHISFTPYVVGEKQDIIVTWEDEEG